MKGIKKYMLCAAAVLMAAFSLGAQEKFGGVVEFDSTTHNFGDVLLSDGPLKCTFTLKNISDKPIAIYSVNSSCGCTDVDWTKQPIRPGETGVVKATYTNDEGPYPFDKTLMVYVSDYKKPITLRFRGVAHQKKQTLNDIFALKMGPLGVRNATIAAGSLEQGRQKSDALTIANLSSKSVKVTFGNISDGLTLSKQSLTIAPKSTEDVNWTLTADKSRWGFNSYTFELIADGKKAGKITVNASTKENFDSVSKEEKLNAPRPMFASSTFNFSKVKAGTPVDVKFELTNAGKSTLKVYKVDSDNPKLSCSEVKDLAASGKSIVKMKLDTAGMPSGEVLIVVTLTTNSPLRPVVNLFVTGVIE